MSRPVAGLPDVVADLRARGLGTTPLLVGIDGFGGSGNAPDGARLTPHRNNKARSIAPGFVLQLGAENLNLRAQLEQSRPHVVVDFSAPQGGGAMFVEIRNAGLTAAREIALSWSDRPEISDAEASHAMTQWVFDGSIPFLAPGRSISYYLGAFPDQEHRTFIVSARYFGASNQVWTSESVLSFAQWAFAEVDRDPLLDIASQTKRIAEEVNKMQRQSEDTNRLIGVVADYFRQTPEFKRSRTQSRVQRYERQRVAHQIWTRSASGATPD